ncbi:SLATT domain-containing protein [Adhaeribacter aquaticus]|uniref:SLATT domain-containing protein n=1 Tax=Adhaeribacter aquaticus TaxID=299567 RepID=UPI00041300FC|nr:SLATT domain-containing protein [Adhaeribacter aquaticus]
MTKEVFLKTLATKGYDIGFGAKKNFASFDIINKLPSWIGFISLAIGILQIAYENIIYNKELSIILIFAGIAIIYLEVYKNKTDDYEKEGIRLTRLFNNMRDLYYKAKSDSSFRLETYENEYQNLLYEFYSKSISKQVFTSQWYAHFKFFYEMQIEWIDEQLKFSFIKDKLPNSLKIIILILLLILIIQFVNGYSQNLWWICK